MQKFLENRELVPFCASVGNCDMRKEDYIAKVHENDRTFFVLPNGDKHGPSEERGGDEILKENWKDGKLHGPWSFERNNNILEEGNYVDGKKEGEEKSYHKDGYPIYYREFRDGKLNGLFVMFWPSGEVRRVIEYTDNAKGVEVLFSNRGRAIRAVRHKRHEIITLPLEVCDKILERTKNLSQ
ncbi:hypothetical protein LAU_0155 [Lausannevirus]|uniref:MORN repeat-containing protein n=2 Tax=Lausannevirus TaxID=999883 RepID=A0A0N9PUD1_9VIRU|nr:hypothetical protein LAU_0155 [Lausannevirus]AEA07006.1 hypothetical protein LAU_0155 [Lausannevirus]ALH06833.1 hypothetical protein PMV_135 [Port-miou virus]